MSIAAPEFHVRLRVLRVLHVAEWAALPKVTNILMKTTGECLSAETIEAGGKTHTAFVFIKPHANNEKAPKPENWDAWGCVGCWVYHYLLCNACNDVVVTFAW